MAKTERFTAQMRALHDGGQCGGDCGICHERISLGLKAWGSPGATDMAHAELQAESGGTVSREDARVRVRALELRLEQLETRLDRSDGGRAHSNRLDKLGADLTRYEDVLRDWVARVDQLEKRFADGVNVTIQRVEVNSDDPDRFATGLVDTFKARHTETLDRAEGFARAHASAMADAAAHAAKQDEILAGGVYRDGNGPVVGLASFTPYTDDPTTQAITQLGKLRQERDEARRLKGVAEREAIEHRDARSKAEHARDAWMAKAEATERELAAAVEHAGRIIGERDEASGWCEQLKRERAELQQACERKNVKINELAEQNRIAHKLHDRGQVAAIKEHDELRRMVNEAEAKLYEANRSAGLKINELQLQLQASGRSHAAAMAGVEAHGKTIAKLQDDLRDSKEARRAVVQQRDEGTDHLENIALRVGVQPIGSRAHNAERVLAWIDEAKAKLEALKTGEQIPLSDKG